MLMTCPTVRPGMADALVDAALVALDACWVAAKTGASAPDNARSAAKIPTAALIVAIFFVLVFFIFFSSHARTLESIYWEGTVRIYRAYIPRVQ